MQEHIAYLFVLFIKTNKYAYSFLDLLAVVISVTSLLIVTYGALIGIISF